MASSFKGGILGGGIILITFIIVLFGVNLFDYRISIEKINVNNTEISDSTKFYSSTEIFEACDGVKERLIDDLSNDKLILTPQEYTNNVVSYYNSLIVILSVIIGAFSILSFIYFKNQVNDQIQEKLQSEEFQEQVGEKLIGKAEDVFRSEINANTSELEVLRNRISTLESGNETNDSGTETIEL